MNFGFCHYHKYRPTWAVKHQRLTLVMASCFKLHRYYFESHVFMLYVSVRIRNHRASDKITAVHKSYTQVLSWTKSSTVWGFWGCKVLREILHSGHTLYTVAQHIDVGFLQKSIKCQQTLLSWNWMLLLHIYMIHTTSKHIKLVENRLRLHRETKRENWSRREVPDDAGKDQVKNHTRNIKISTISQKSV
jgi:hypothetical protein